MLKLLLSFVVASQAANVLKSPEFKGPDVKRPHISISLEEWATGLPQITDIQNVPGQPNVLFVLQKTGEVIELQRSHPATRSTVLKLAVRTASELGLLGLAFHPRFSQNRKIYINYNPADGEMRTRISEWTLGGPPYVAEKERILLEVKQPYPNHNAGQLLFGPDAMLYFGLGDGGDAGDPHNNAQNPKSLLGKMLRIDVDTKVPGKPYAIPKDNPFRLDPKYAPEIFATGLRNPWRFSFSPKGRMIVADVGQNSWEEVDLVLSGANYGWKVREAAHCYSPAQGCSSKGLTEPWLQYGREDGASITGGHVYMGNAIPALRGMYLFGDFVSGRIWAANPPTLGFEGTTVDKFSALGRWPISLSTFGRDSYGEVYVADFAKGVIYRISPP